jgi:hypothetical protein
MKLFTVGSTTVLKAMEADSLIHPNDQECDLYIQWITQKEVQ